MKHLIAGLILSTAFVCSAEAQLPYNVGQSPACLTASGLFPPLGQITAVRRAAASIICDELKAKTSAQPPEQELKAGRYISNAEGGTTCRSALDAARDLEIVQRPGPGPGRSPEAHARNMAKFTKLAELAKANCDEEKRLEAEQRRQFEEALPVVEARLQKEAEHKRQQQEKMAKESDARIAAMTKELSKPINRLAKAYSLYLLVTLCHESRQGYAVVEINDVQKKRARDAVSRIEKLILKEDPTIDATAEWKVVGSMSREIRPDQCKGVYDELISLAPALPTTKDF